MREFVTAYGPKRKVFIVFPEQGRTKQAHKAECDINTIMAKFQRTGVLEFVNEHAPRYGDVVGIDFQTAMQQVIDAQAMFDDLPAKIRKRFDNSPEEFLAFMSDPENAEEARSLGLLEEPKGTPQPPRAEAPIEVPEAPKEGV